MTVDLSDLPYARLGLPQNDTERLLTRHLSSFGLEIERGISLEDLTHNGWLRASSAGRWGWRPRGGRLPRDVIGCDGADTAVRQALGIAFEGSAIPLPFMLGDVHIDPWSVRAG